MATTVWCTTSFIGWHRWPDAPDSVVYLRMNHRHVFKVRVEVWVDHANRDVEFHTLKIRVDEYLKSVMYNMQEPDAASYSCEMIADGIGRELISEKIRVKEVTVSEDGECGATVNF